MSVLSISVLSFSATDTNDWISDKHELMSPTLRLATTAEAPQSFNKVST